ncbi:FAD-dependent monooxygenase [Chelativorans alearense]|uniref:FAD-dependent monooxygenase n=1 Tax=Chelativorans alearense TaxID=2681495 RepID=UPI0013CFA9A8|nr:FAD-dependent monooxygenase [Chelativorans alearense]
MTGRRIAIAGAGIAGLTAALCFAAKGFSVAVFERAETLQEVGAGLQLSPNATRILARLGVLESLGRNAVRPRAILLKDAARLSTLAGVTLGQKAERRWQAPYLVAHRADLQKALLQRVRDNPAIRLELGTKVRDAALRDGGTVATVAKAGQAGEVACDLLIGADGVWSQLRACIGGRQSRFTGFAAFRAILRGGAASDQAVGTLAPDAVTAFLAPDFHLVAYPVSGGADLNLVLVTRSAEIGRGWANAADMAHLLAATRRAAPALSDIVRLAGAWTAWPIHEVQPGGPWTNAGLALIGDAAHALSPYAAQGAAMAIEDAALLAELTAAGGDMPGALAAYERLRKPRLARVARRGAFNRFVWHAGGPVALARDVALRLKSEESLAADLDWLYSYDVEGV